MSKKGIKEVLQTEMLDFTAPLLINNLPSIDGLLVSQRQVIWGMYKANMNSKGSFYKMLKATGKIFDYYVLGDMPLTGVMKNMGNNYILHKYLMPKGSFGNKNSRDGEGASPRYIECKLDPYAETMLEGIKKHSVEMKWNYDATEKEPILLPSIIPNILTNFRMSISVSEANRMPSHNLIEVCDCIKSYIDTKDIDKSIEILKCPDLPSFGSIIYNKKAFDTIYKTGKGSFVNVGKYRYDEKKNTIVIYEIPYMTYIENIYDEIEKNFDKFESEVEDFHDGTDRKGLNLELYLKKGANVDIVVQKLRKYTSFESNFPCNFTLLDLNGKTPKLCSLQDIIEMWLTHRVKCITNEYNYDLDKIKNELHLLNGLKSVIDYIDEIVKLIRSSATKKIAIDEIISKYNLDEEQAKYIASIQLINLTQDYVLTKVTRIDELDKEKNSIETILSDKKNIYEIIKTQLDIVKKQFGKPRQTEIIYEDKVVTLTKKDIIEDYNCRILLTTSLIKKHLKQSNAHKLKPTDEIIGDIQTNNKNNVYVFTDKANKYMVECNSLQTFTPQSYGESIYALFPKMKKDEKPLCVVSPNTEKGYMLIVFKNGKIAKVDIKSYISNFKLQINAFNQESEVVFIDYIEKDEDILLISTSGKGLIINSSDIGSKSSKTTKGIRGIKLDEGEEVVYSKVVEKDHHFTITTNKRDIDYILDDKCECQQSKDERPIFEYIKGRNGNKGNNLIKFRKDEIIESIK